MRRAILVTLGLSAAGAVFGAIAGLVAQVAWMLLEWDGWFRYPEVLVFGAGMGMIAGAVLAPLTAWLLMRHVPLGLAFGGTLLGTVAGAAVGATMGSLPGAIYGGFIGYAASALVLRFRVARPPRAVTRSTERQSISS
ncbi:hypothetical protein [Longimicrobium terrae]|uniref:ABC-type uncharacterized transport system permease subunit n=1 Tax=Longimicrobium terrae TaxID=1639882 RepID=A0A841H4F3_9BACT|nr:hypothetical protein [Longimicrobium terrae]MBB4638698.1 hypothetical protein [Longimicrobium terrae]MBB6072937.1 ABC-type uncharacterized transport system permease subunit [Longimicrobium terrae]NNC31549.1 hypothetical protein [Longimicrobium terrae]